MSVVAFAIALAAGEPSSGFLICSSQDSSSGRTIVYVGEPVRGSDDDIPAVKNAFINEVQQRYGIRLPYGGCATAYTRKEAKDAYDYATEYPTRHNADVVVLKWSGDRGRDWSSSSSEPVRERRQANETSASSDASTKEAAAGLSPHRPKMTNAEADAKFAADKAEYQRKLAQNAAEYKAAQKSVEDQKSEQRAAAQRALTAYQQQLQAHDQAVREQREAHAAEVAKYESELAARKVRADFDKRNGLGKASTDTDANQCVTSAETRLNDTFKGNTSASIINGCGQPVDVRICLMTDRGWNCGVRWGVASQARASFSSFNATGQVFVDAKTTGSAKALASPN